MHDSLIVVAAILGIVCIFSIALSHPRLVLYLILALCPTQFVFIPLSTFFISPADVLVLAAAGAFIVRLAAGSRSSLVAIWKHRYLFMMVGVYLLGFVILDVFSRTLLRVLIGISPSILAYEVLRTRSHVRRAAVALVCAGFLDAAYGLLFYFMGSPLYPGRFSGMSGVNFSATAILTAAAIMFARRGLARNWTSLTRPGILATIGVATLSQGGVFAFLVSWVVVLRRAVSRRNTMRMVLAIVILGILVLSSATVRDRFASRNRRTTEIDGVARNSADVRLMILGVAWRAFSASPVWGIGYGQFQSFSNTNPDILTSTGGEGYGTHNTYIEILVEGGLLAFLCFTLHFAQYVPGLRRVLSELTSSKNPVAASGLVGVPLVLVAATLSNALLVYHFWAVCGLGLACLRVEHEAEQPVHGAHVSLLKAVSVTS